jgi:hypothetical protein
MTAETPSAHATSTPAGGPFPPAEIDTLHALDREAGRNIVVLLGGLFIVGLILYSFVYLWVRG